MLALGAALLLFLAGAGKVLFPKGIQMEATWDLWGAFEKEPENTLDFVVLGSSLSYCNIIPAQIYEETGFTSYLVSSPRQTLALSYYSLKECWRRQKPSAVFLEVSSFYYPPSTTYTSATVGSMPLSMNRLEATFFACPQEDWMTLLFPLYGYHSRWDKLTQEDWDLGLGGYQKDLLAGYSYLTSYSPQSQVTQREDETTPDSLAWNRAYLEKLKAFCDQKQIPLVCFLAPGMVRYGQQERERLEFHLKTMEIPLVDYNEDFEEFGFDLQRDFYDTSHLNYTGAEKFTKAFSQLVVNTLGEETPRKNKSPLWEQRVRLNRQLRVERTEPSVLEEQKKGNQDK